MPTSLVPTYPHLMHYLAPKILLPTTQIELTNERERVIPIRYTYLLPTYHPITLSRTFSLTALPVFFRNRVLPLILNLVSLHSFYVSFAISILKN